MFKNIGSHKKNALAVYSLDGRRQYYHLEAIASNNSIRITETRSYNSIDELKESGVSDVTICYSSSSVLSDVSAGADPEKALQNVIPGAKADDFFIQCSSENQNDFEFVNAHEVNQVVSELSAVGIHVTSIVLEKAALHALYNNLEKRVPGVIHEINNDGIVSAVQPDHEARITIEGKTRNAYEILAFGALLRGFDTTALEWNVPVEVLGNQKESEGKQLLKRVTVGSVVVILLVSLINLFLFQSYTNELAEVDKKLYSSNATQERLQALTSQVEIQNELLSGLNRIQPKTGAYFLDQLAQRIPKQVNLSYLGLEPPKKIKSRKKIIFAANELIVEGRTVSTLALNNWIEDIGDMENVTDVKLLSYEDNKENRGKFKLQIHLTDA